MVVKRVKKIIEKIMPKRVKLVEIFREWQPVVQGGGSTYLIMKRERHERVTINKLQTYVHYLEKSYPEEGFKLESRRVGLRKYWVVTKDGNKAKLPGIDLWFDLRKQKFYVSEDDLKKNEKLAAYICMRALGVLGVSQSRYVSGRYVEGLGYLKPSQLKKLIKNEPA